MKPPIQKANNEGYLDFSLKKKKVKTLKKEM